MNSQHYDLALLGDAPGGRIAAVLAARAGLRVLHLAGFGWPEELLWCSSDLFEGLLDRINGRSCLIPALPVQFRSGSLCVQFHGETTLADELHREMPESARSLQGIIQDLADRGVQLQKLLSDKGQPPDTRIASKLHWTFGRLFRGLPSRPGERLLTRLKSAEVDEAEAEFIALLTGCLSLRDPAQLDLDTVALLLAQLFNPHQIAPTVLDRLLERKLREAGADIHNAFELTGLHPEKRRFRLDFSAGRAHATTVALAGTPGWVIDGLSASAMKWPRPALWELHGFTGRISRVLASKILLAGPFGPIQMVIGRDDATTRIRLQSGFGPSETVELQSQLAPLFPFADFTPVLRETALPLTGVQGPLGLSSKTKLKGGIQVAGGQLLYPGLGTAGEALAAFQLLHHLGLNKKRGPAS